VKKYLLKRWRSWSILSVLLLRAVAASSLLPKAGLKTSITKCSSIILFLFPISYDAVYNKWIGNSLKFLKEFPSNLMPRLRTIRLLVEK
jgi:hypothetical protein